MYMGWERYTQKWKKEVKKLKKQAQLLKIGIKG